ncbi:MAG: hypothetical protein U5K32_06350 [Bacteroidales bacterium]|nr:hypothetical protein [Bacteroidales bacterium]
MTEYYLEGMKLEEDDPKFLKYVAKYPSVFLKETYDSSTLYLLPHSKILCYIANKDGIYQIGDQIFRIAGNYIYQTGYESNIDELFLPKDQISTKDVTVMLSRPRLETKSDLVQKTINFTNDSRFRIVSSIREYSVWVSNPGFTMWYYDIITNPQKRTWGIWGRAQLNTKSANDEGYIRLDCLGCTEESISGGYDENTGLSQRVIYFGPDYSLDLDDSYSPAYSRGRLIDGTTEYLYICWDDALDETMSYTYYTSSSPNDPY